MKRSAFVSLASSLPIVAAVKSALAAQTGDVWFVSVGCGAYVSAPSGAQSFPDVRGASKSAKIVADLLMDGGARGGILLQSADQLYVSANDVHKALARLKTLTKTSNRCAAIFYFAGHGISEGIGWNHFSIPGNFVYRGGVETLSIDGLGKSALYAGDIADTMDSLKSPYLMLLDTCSSGHAETITSSALTRTAQSNLRDTATIIRNINEFHQSNPVIFSAKPGSDAATVADPTNPDSTVSVAPLCRRFSIIVRRARTSRSDVDVAEFVRAIVDPSLDSITTPGITHASLEGDDNVRIFSSSGSRDGVLEVTHGSASSPCC